MRTTHHAPRFPVLRALPLLLVAACGGHGPYPPPDDGGNRGASRPVECGEGSGASAGAEIGRLGGMVGVRGHSLDVPADAVGNPERFTIMERRSAHIAVDVGPHGASFNSKRATLTLSYARCGGFPAGFTTLQIAEVPPGGTGILRTMPSTVDSTNQTVSTTTEHLSGYLIVGT